MNTKYDIIIIGSGLGGVITGYILAKNGYKVMVLEKNSQFGGCLQTFKRDGVKFDTGMHYIGSMDKGQLLYRFFQYLNLLKDVPLSRLDENGYDVISLNGKRYKYASGYDQYVNTLSAEFPEQRYEIANYVNTLKRIAEQSSLYNLKNIAKSDFMNEAFLQISVNEFLSSFTSNDRLRNVLAGNLPLYAGVKNVTPAYIHALINNSYIQSAFRIVGGSDSIVFSLAQSIRSFGGELLANSEVQQIICDDRKVTSVRLTNGDLLFAKNIISDIHPEATLAKIESPLIKKSYRERITGLQNSMANFTLYIKFKEHSVPYLNYNYYNYSKEEVWTANQYKREEWPSQYLYMHQCYNSDQKYAQSAKLISGMRYEEVEKWANSSVERRGDDYKAFKEECTHLLLCKLEESFPGIRNCIASCYTSTPLTYRDYTATKHGSNYGIIKDKNALVQTFLSHKTKIPNLFLVGQNINFHGFLGVTVGAFITSAEFIGMDKMVRELNEIE